MTNSIRDVKLWRLSLCLWQALDDLVRVLLSEARSCFVKNARIREGGVRITLISRLKVPLAVLTKSMATRTHDIPRKFEVSSAQSSNEKSGKAQSDHCIEDVAVAVM